MDLTCPLVEDVTQKKGKVLTFYIRNGRHVRRPDDSVVEFSNVAELATLMKGAVADECPPELDNLVECLNSMLQTPERPQPKVNRARLLDSIQPTGCIGKAAFFDTTVRSLFETYEVTDADVSSRVASELGLLAGDSVCGSLATALRSSSPLFYWHRDQQHVLHLRENTKLVVPIFVNVEDRIQHCSFQILLSYTFIVV